jgi:hypothetical protein
MTWKEKRRRESKRWINIFHGEDICERSEREYDDQLIEKIQTEKRNPRFEVGT